MNAPTRTLFSMFRHRSQKESRNAIPLDWNFSTDVMLLMGTGLEEFAEFLLTKGAERVVLCLPPGAEQVDLGPEIQVVGNEDQMRAALMLFPEPMPNHFMLLASEQWPAQEEFGELRGWLDNMLTSKAIFHNTVDAIGPVLMEQGMRNIPMIAAHPSVASIKGKFKGKPAIIVSPGPSLSKNIALLKAFKHKAVIITGTHSLSAFKSAGVHPDFVMAVDVGDLTTHYDDYDMTQVEALVLGNTTRRVHFEQPAKRILTLPANKNSDEWFYKAFDESVDMHTGGSVACTALSLAEHMGCTPIILAGQDLSFPGNKYYADECVHGAVEVVETEAGVYLKADEHLIDGMVKNEAGDLLFAGNIMATSVAGYHGGMVRSSKVLRGFLWWFENYIKHRSALGPVWNCTEGGARISGARQLPLAEALAELGEIQTNVPAILNACLADHDVARRRDALLEHFQGIKNDLFLCFELAKRCKTAVPAAAQDRWSLSKLQTMEARLTEATKSVRCLAMLSQREITATLAEARNAPDLGRNLAASLRLYDIIQRGSEFLMEPLGAGLQELAELKSVA